KVGVGSKLPYCLVRKRPCKDFWIVDRHFKINVTEVAPVKAFGNPERLGLRMSRAVQPAEVIKTSGRDDESVTFPSPDGISEPARIGIVGKIAPVSKHCSMRAVRRLVHNHGQTRRLNNPGEVKKIVEWNTDGLASCEGAILPVITHPLQKQRFG